MENYISEKSVRDLFQLFGDANGIAHVGPVKHKYLRELMEGDVVLLDRESTDYNGRLCSVTTPKYKKPVFFRVYIDGDEIHLCDATDNDVQATHKLDEVHIESIAVGIVRRFEPIPMDAADLNQHKSLFDKIKAGMVGSDRYMLRWEEMEAIKQKERGSLFGSLYAGFYYGFYQGRKAERNAAKRKLKTARKARK